MGIEHEIIPKDYNSAIQAGEVIFKQQIAKSEAGEVLKNALVEYMADVLRGHFSEVPKAMIHYFIGDEASHAIGLDIKHNWLDHLTEGLMGHIFSKNDVRKPHGFLWNKLSAAIQTKFLQGLIDHYNENQPVRFFIPPSLRADWNLD